MSARIYDISRLPILERQVTFLVGEKEDFIASIDNCYEQFLGFVDSKSDQFTGNELEALQNIYELVAGRKDLIISEIREERDDLKALLKTLDEIKTNNDTEQWSFLAADLLEDESYIEDYDAFTAHIRKEIETLGDELANVLDDWRSSIEEGDVVQLSMILEAFSKEEEEEMQREAQESLAELALDDNGEACGVSCEEKGDQCCGRQDPCCRSK